MKRSAFTLVELLVVIAIIGLLSSVAVVALSGAGMNARNAKRKADLVQISKALEMYYSDNGAYPSTGGGWWGNCSFYGGHPDSGSSGWIPNLAPAYMAMLPHDSNTGLAKNQFCVSSSVAANRSCYLYMSDGKDYKALAFCTPEGATAAIIADPMCDKGQEAGGYSYSVSTAAVSTLW
jgi:prepilin-type N-terminal cleavage/methylation domain-containing protein